MYACASRKQILGPDIRNACFLVLATLANFQRCQHIFTVTYVCYCNSGPFVQQEQWERSRAKRKLVSGGIWVYHPREKIDIEYAKSCNIGLEHFGVLKHFHIETPFSCVPTAFTTMKTYFCIRPCSIMVVFSVSSCSCRLRLTEA